MLAGNNVAGVTIGLTGTTNTSTTTDAQGNYSFPNLPGGGNYLVTPAGTGFSFSPVNFSFINLDVNRIANFVATQTQVNITGTVVDANDAALNNVTVALTKNGASAGTTQTNVLGNYSFLNLEAGASYAVTPVGTFAPQAVTLNNLTTNATANFKSSPSIPPQCNTGSFGTATNFLPATFPYTVVTGDFNNDAKLDLAVTNQGSNNVSILLGAGNGTFGTATNFVVGTLPNGLATGDFDGNGNLDLVVANRNSNNISILLGTGTGTFGAATNFAVGTVPISVAVAAFNNDGKADVAVANQTANNISILLGTGTGSLGAATTFAVGSFPFAVAAGDLNGDGKVDLVAANFGSNNVSILLGTGTGSFGAATNFAAGSGPNYVAISDLNSDGKIDLAVADFSSASLSILVGNGTGGFGAPTSFGVGTNPQTISVGDFNGDTKLDLAVANRNSNNVSILLGLGTGNFLAAANFAVGAAPLSAAIGDFNGDGKTDLVSANSSSNDLSVLLNDGQSCNTQASLSISGRTSNAANNALAEVTVTLSGPISRVAQTDASGNYSFLNLVPGGNYSVTVQSNYFTFAPSRADFFNLSSSQVANFVAAPLAVPSPTPTPNDDFGNSARDASKWTIGVQTSATTAFDPQVITAQTNGQLVVTPLTQAKGMHFAGYVSANSFDMRNGSAKVEVVKAGTGGVDTIFAVGTDVDNFYRFMVHTPGAATTLAPRARGRDGIERPLDATTAQLIFQVS